MMDHGQLRVTFGDQSLTKIQILERLVTRSSTHQSTNGDDNSLLWLSVTTNIDWDIITIKGDHAAYLGP